MQPTLETLARECHRLLAAGDTPAARAQVAGLLGQALRDPAFLRTQFAGTVPERRIVHEDPELGFCILVHEYHDARQGGPHDHGPSWAIYGQAEGETTMSDFVVVQPAGAGRRAKVRRTRSYALRPGDVHVYNEGEIHAPARGGFSRLVRIEGTNLEKVARGTYEVLPD